MGDNSLENIFLNGKTQRDEFICLVFLFLPNFLGIETTL